MVTLLLNIENLFDICYAKSEKKTFAKTEFKILMKQQWHTHRHTHMNTHAQQFKCLANLLALSEIAEVSLEIRMVYIDKIMLSEMSTTAK